jgi:hypothetical protein
MRKLVTILHTSETFPRQENLHEHIRLVSPQQRDEPKQGEKWKAEPDWNGRIKEETRRLREGAEDLRRQLCCTRYTVAEIILRDGSANFNCPVEALKSC